MASLPSPRKAVPYALVWELAKTLWDNAREQIAQNLSAKEQTEFRNLLKKSKGRPKNLTKRDRSRLTSLTKKAATGSGKASWQDVASKVPRLIPPQSALDFWDRRRGKR